MDKKDVTYGLIGDYCEAHGTVMSGVAIVLLGQVRSDDGRFDYGKWEQIWDEFIEEVAEWAEGVNNTPS